MFLLKLVSRLPMPVLYFISDLMFVMICFVLAYRKKVVMKNLANAFPEKSEEERKDMAKEFYKRFSEYIVETLKAVTISRTELLERVKYLNVPDVQHHANSGQSIIVIASHQFNWEWALLAGCLTLPFPVDAVYQKLSNQAFDRLMLRTRGRFGGSPVEKSRVLREILRSKDRLRALGIVADQSPRKNHPSTGRNSSIRTRPSFSARSRLPKLHSTRPTFFTLKG